jgi:hypothetical protein
MNIEEDRQHLDDIDNRSQLAIFIGYNPFYVFLTFTYLSDTTELIDTCGFIC